MQDKDVQTLNNFYTGLYKQYGYDSRSTGYSEEGQRTRYKVLANIAPLKGKKVLEIGSGLGHFCQFLKRNVPGVLYSGFDINETFVRAATENVGPHFSVHNILTKQPTERYDAVFSIGILNTKINDNVAVTKGLIKAMFEACTEFAALSMTSVYVDKEWVHDHMFYYQPDEMFTFAKGITKNVCLIHDYLPHDFTLILKKP